MKNVFISYSNEDYSFAKDLFERLSSDGVNCFFDKETIQWGDNWILSLAEALAKADYVILIISRNYITSKWTTYESTIAMIDDPNGETRKIRPLLLDDCELPNRLKTIQYIDVSSKELFEKNYPTICTELGGKIIKSNQFHKKDFFVKNKSKEDGYTNLAKITYKQLNEANCLSEFSKIFNTETKAINILEDCEVPMEKIIQPFSGMTPFGYWKLIFRELEKGLIDSGLIKFILAAINEYPHNEKFKYFVNNL